MKVLISTPCSGGLLHERYVGSLLASVMRLRDLDPELEVAVHFQGKESLIHRARNRAAMYFQEGGYDKLFTIDADIEWTIEDFRRIIYSPHKIIGGVYPLKSFPVVMNFNALPERGAELLSQHRGFDLETYKAFVHKYADEGGIAEVRHLPTGFLCVSREVFAKLSETVEVYWNIQPDTGERKGFFNYYPSGVHEGTLESEDWGFCRLARAAGYPIMLDTKVLLSHTGNWTFRLGQFFGESTSALALERGVDKIEGLED